MKKSFFSVLMVMVILLSAVVSPLNTSFASDDSSEVKPESIVLDFSFFNLDATADSDKYSEGANKFFNDCGALITALGDTNFNDIDAYLKCASALKYSEINKYLDDDKYALPLGNYLNNDDRASSILYYVQLLYDFEDKYKSSFESYTIGKVDELLDEASGMGKSEMLDAIDIYNKAIKICDAPIIMFGDNYKPAVDKKAEAQAGLKKVQNIDPKIFSSDVHKNNVGKILFSSKSFVSGKETASTFSTKYTASSNIYAIAYLTTGVKTLAPEGSYDGTYIAYETAAASASITIDGEINQYGGISVPINIQDYKANKGYIKFELLPNEKSTVGYSLSDWYDFLFSKLKPGKHVIGIQLMLNDGKVAEGQFELDWTNANLAQISKNIKKCEKIAAEYRANLRKVPEQFTVKHKKYDDASLSDAKIKALFLKENKNATKILKFVNIGDITDGWSVEKDDWNIPVAKYSTMETWVIYKAKDGWCYITEFKLKSTYTGAGTWGNPYIYNQMAPAKIAAKNVK